MKKVHIIIALCAVCAGGFFAGSAPYTYASTKCVFSKDLEYMMIDEDVRCLQRYLNESGYTVATSGIGSSGRETNMFGDKTKQAVIQWQRANNLPGSGFFGPRSREKYAIITQSENQTVANAPSQSTNIANATIAQLQAQVAKLLAQVSSLQGSTTGSITKSDAETAIRHAHTTIDDVVDDLEDFDSNDIGNANTVIQNAKNKLASAQKYLDEKDYKNSFVIAREASDLAQKALDEVDDSEIEKRRSAHSDIEAAQNALDKARDEIKRADSINLEIGDAEDMFDDAEDMFDDAEDYFDKKEYAKASKAAQESIRLGGIALDEIEY